MVDCQNMPMVQDNASFASLDHCVYMRKATTEDGRAGYAMFDSDGQLEMFSEHRSDVFFYAMRNELTYVLLN